MNKFKTNNKREKQLGETVDKRALIFGFISVFLCGLGFTIISPVVPFLVEPYVHSSAEQAMMVTLLTSAYAACVFLAAPVLGALSDRYGRKPILLICILGSAIGYFIFGIGGALWMLFLGRIIDGITGGNISTIFAYFADIITNENRTKYFGWISAFVGLGVILGPTLGGVLAKFGYSIPFYFGAIITLLNLVYGFFFMPETLKEENKLKEITFGRINPFRQLFEIFTMKNLSRLFIAGFLLWAPSGAFQGLFSQFTMNSFNWGPFLIGIVCSIMGVQDIISQGLIIPRMIGRFTDKEIATIGMIAEVIGYGFIGISALYSFYPFFILGMFIFGFGDSIFGSSFNAMLSKSADASEQGRIQGGSQAIQSLARIIGPIVGGEIYISLGHSSFAFMGMILVAIAIPILYKGIIKN